MGCFSSTKKIHIIGGWDDVALIGLFCQIHKPTSTAVLLEKEHLLPHSPNINLEPKADFSHTLILYYTPSACISLKSYCVVAEISCRLHSRRHP